MTGERVDLELQQMDATIFDEFIDTMECNLYCRCGAPNDAVQNMASAILALRAQVAALAGEKAATGRRLDAAEGVVKAALAWYEIPGSWDDEAAWLSQACDEWKRVCAEVDAARGGEG